MQWIKDRRLELQRIIDSINSCYTTNNKTGFTLNSTNGVIWAKTRRSKKWGQAFEDDFRFYVAIDFPEGSYELDELIERIGLNVKEEDEQVSGIRLRKDSPFDSVRIAVYEDMSATYSFDNKEFIDFVNEVASKVMNK
ncbi:hypothetical protein GH741_02645 [Aquibacillus halophilus]|uniref:DUF4304 domain-containing protein n=1 Tax=Aquibacillus halophilus TaxID=930132 RepID=A0A6A8D8H3_9BACI|nr:hypothetical protein [Aquibacillus halophilus]MRH41570.1 hypothetical protein [Aquibacillus halophilus]